VDENKKKDRRKTARCEIIEKNKEMNAENNFGKTTNPMWEIGERKKQKKNEEKKRGQQTPKVQKGTVIERGQVGGSTTRKGRQGTELMAGSLSRGGGQGVWGNSRNDEGGGREK